MSESYTITCKCDETDLTFAWTRCNQSILNWVAAERPGPTSLVMALGPPTTIYFPEDHEPDRGDDHDSK